MNERELAQYLNLVCNSVAVLKNPNGQSNSNNGQFNFGI